VWMNATNSDLNAPSSLDVSASFNLLHTYENAHEADVNAVRWNPVFAGLLASAGDDKCINLWRLKNWM